MRLLVSLLLLPVFVAANPIRAAESDTDKNEKAGGYLAPGYQREMSPWLTHDEARLRALTVGNVEYQLEIDLTGEEVYQGAVIIGFDYSPSPYALTLDFQDGTVESVEADSKPVAFDYSGDHVSIEPGLLKDGLNELTIRYSHTYSQTGAGLYRYVDSTDGRVYLYTHFEPWDANKLAPMFDQPSLRAHWTLTVKAPDDWTVVTTVLEDRIERGEENATWYFPPSPSTPSYILPLHAGQYHVWEGQAGDTPLRLFARESLAEHVMAEWLLKITTDGIAWFEGYFDEPYPYEKYDQLIVPDFNIGGMENVAAVTYTENYIPRGEPTRERLEGIAGTFLHELAHMWFGNLVTIDWWNALWLKESFASIMDPLAMAGATDFDTAWLSFYLGTKQYAYLADQFVTTHPIEMPVRDTKSGDASFDAITYSKGASVLKQLKHFLGENTFRDGVREYLNRYPWTAATLPDFMNTLGDISGRDMHAWTRDWLETAGVNTVKADYRCENGQVAGFRLLQIAPKDYPTVRSHRLQVGLFGLSDGIVSPGKVVAVELSSTEMPVPALDGEACPVLVYPNIDDWAFIRVLLDASSLAQAPKILSSIEDPMLRSMIWQALWDGVRDQDAPLSAYLDIALEHMPAETNTAMLQSLLSKLEWAKYYLYAFGERASELRGKYLPAMEAMTLRQTLASEVGSDLQKQWFDSWVNQADSKSGQNRLAQWLEGDAEPLNLNQDQDRRWDALTNLAALGYPGIKELRESEAQRDPSDMGKLNLITMDGAQPVADAKAKYLDSLEDYDSDQTSAQLKASLRWMFPAGQEAILQQFSARILAKLPELDSKRDQDLVGVITSTILPALCTTESVEALSRSISDRGSLTLGATKALRVTHQEDQRCVDIASRQLGGLWND